MTDEITTYGNPRTSAVIEDWPMGARSRGTATFTIEANGKGERARRTTQLPGKQPGYPRVLTYARRARIVDGSDGRTYVIEDNSDYGHVTVMRGDMKYAHETIYRDDPRHAEVMELFEQEVPTV